MHQHHIDRQPMQPGGKGRITAKARNLAVQLQESLLGEVFGFREITEPFTAPLAATARPT